MRGSYFSEFYFDKDTISSFVKVFDRNVPASKATSAAIHRLHVSRPFRDGLLKDSLFRLFPTLKMTEDYFEILENSLKEDKKNKISKEKKIRKFFGEKPSVNQMNYQNMSQASPKAKSGGMELFKSTTITSDSISEVSNSSESLAQLAKMRQVKKLHGFFGDINFTKDLDAEGSNKSLHELEPLFENSMDLIFIADANEADRLNQLPALSNDSNNLDQKVKMQLSRTRMKIVQVMGGEVNDELIVKTQTGNVTKLNAELESGEESSSSSDSDDIETTIARDIRIRRLNKLRQYLGEKVTEADMGSLSRPQSASSENRTPLKDSHDQIPETDAVSMRNDTSPDTKALQMKRSKKLGHMFGELPPPKLIHTPDAHVKTAHRHRMSIHELESFIKIKNQEEVLDLASNFFSMDQILESEPTSPSIVVESSTSILSPNGNIVLTESQKEKSMRKKKIDKLKNFFGDNADVGVILEHAVIEDIERDIDEDLKELLELKQELERIKAALKVKGNFELGELENDLKKVDFRTKKSHGVQVDKSGARMKVIGSAN